MFHGWRMVGVAFSAHLIASGLGFYALPRLLDPLAAEFTGGDRLAVTLLGVAMSLPGLIVGPVIGRVLTRHPLKRMMPLSALVMGLGFAAATQAGALWHLAIVYAVAVPIGVSTLSAIGANALVANWFDRQRPLALGLSQFGLSIAGAVVVFFISWTLELGGWRATYAAFAVILFAAAPLLWWTIADRPSDRGLHPDGDAPPENVAPAVAWSFGEAIRDRNLWLAGMTAGLCFGGATGLLQNAHAYVTDAGHSADEANVVFAALSIGAAFGKLLFGALGVRFGERASFILAVTSEAFFLAAFPSAAASVPLLLGAGFGVGLALGGVMPALAAFLARIYGAGRLAAALGYISPIMIPFQMLGAPIAARVSDQTGSYDPALYGFAVACLVALVLLLQIRGQNGRATAP